MTLKVYKETMNDLMDEKERKRKAGRCGYVFQYLKVKTDISDDLNPCRAKYLIVICDKGQD